jgi:hypothetical protein
VASTPTDRDRIPQEVAAAIDSWLDGVLDAQAAPMATASG